MLLFFARFAANSKAFSASTIINLPTMADMLLGDINNAIAELEKLEYPTPTRMAQEKNLPVEAKMFNHGGRRKTVKK